MSLASQIAADITSVFLNTDEVARSVTRYPLGVVPNAVPITVIWEPDDDEKRNSGQHEERGRDNIRMGWLRVAAAAAVVPADRWLIDSAVWETQGIQTVDGMQYARLVRVENELRNTGPQRLI